MIIVLRSGQLSFYCLVALCTCTRRSPRLWNRITELLPGARLLISAKLLDAGPGALGHVGIGGGGALRIIARLLIGRGEHGNVLVRFWHHSTSNWRILARRLVGGTRLVALLAK